MYMDYPLSDDDILKAVKGKTNIILYSDLPYVKNVDQILYPYGSCILLYEQFPASGHWVVLTLNKKKNELEYFNSYGEHPDEFLQVVDDKLKKQLNEDYPYLSKLLLDSPYNLAYNQYKLQKEGNDIATCGRYVVLRVLLKELPLDTFVKIFNQPNMSPDDVAVDLTKNLF